MSNPHYQHDMMPVHKNSVQRKTNATATGLPKMQHYMALLLIQHTGQVSMMSWLVVDII